MFGYGVGSALGGSQHREIVGSIPRHTAGYLPHFAGGLPHFAGWDTIVGADPVSQAAAAAVQQVASAPPHMQALMAQHLARSPLGNHPIVQQALGGAGNPYPASMAPSSVAYGSNLGVQQSPSSKPRLFPIGFTSGGTVAASGTVIITSRPQILFRPERLIVPSAVATNFQINDIRVGKNSQLVQASPLPASAFVETAIDTRMTLDTAQEGIDLSLNVTNTDAGAAHAFSALMFGAAIDN